VSAGERGRPPDGVDGPQTDVIDNVPITIVVIPVISFGAGLGGNATVIGATANIVVVTQADRAG
jgi:Na+/H+ antiporter NhaD/arsenite permease-like protein